MCRKREDPGVIGIPFGIDQGALHPSLLYLLKLASLLTNPKRERTKA